MSAFNKILEKYRKYSFSQQDKGERFERLMQGYLKTDPKYTNLFKKVWLWNEFPGKIDLGGSDTGIDLVALTFTGDYWAIQCKCYQETSTIDKPAVDSFLSTSSREFKNEELKTTRFSQRLWISTTNKWGPNATEAIKNQNPPVTRINLYDLREAPVDWEKLENGIHGEESRTEQKTPRKHQLEAISNSHEYFKSNDRGKLIMACGTGKTYTSLCIAEKETDGKGLILFLVPSIALLGQTLREWSAEAKEPINAICICSDSEISKKRIQNDEGEAISVIDLAWPASTNTQDILNQFKLIKERAKAGMTVVFSTYQSIEVIARAQAEILKNGFNEFDLIICDEAHRTTGVTLAGEDESAFTKVHSNNFVKAKKRLYMTATPRLFDDNSKSKAAKEEAFVWSMDSVEAYGKEIYRIGFGQAVELDLLTDYKVLVLALSDQDVPPAVQNMIANGEYEINSDDASKLVGCINALSKQMLGDAGILKESDPDPMRRALAFCPNIDTSKKITSIFNTTADTYLDALPEEKKRNMVSASSRHIDGTMSAPYRDELIGWLKAETEDNECRILTNVRCLSEGVDVPTLDAVLFLSARNSQVDVVQSVGRVMRKAGPSKKYGYIIIPVVVPSDIEPELALDDNERYKVVWTVLNALRAHDDRFNAIVNKIELNKQRPNQILVGRPEISFDANGDPFNLNEHTLSQTENDISRQMTLQFQQLQHVIFARMVKKVGDKRYWEQWAKDIANIAERQIERIKLLIADGNQHQRAFDKFLGGLQTNINPSISQDQAIEMLAQHIITQPVFEALFKGYSFVKNNAVSQAMQLMLDDLQGKTIQADNETLDKFYDSVRKRAADIDNSAGKQRIIIELYDKFFKTAFPKMVEQLGIVYTPIEVVDFIIHSVSEILVKEFNRNISDENIHILDPFTGTGTFITRLLQSGLIKNDDLERKYQKELHANEIVLLAYYIAAVNIENAYHDNLLFTKTLEKTTLKDGNTEVYEPFEGICLTDTFQIGEAVHSDDKLFSEMFPQNSKRVQSQKRAPLRIIMGNPPYSVGQKSANDNAQNQTYPILDRKVSDTYAKESSATSVKALYDPYIKAFRWATDRLDQNGGIIGFITNSGWIEKGGADGLRKCFEKEFTSVYIFNLRGAIKGKSGETAKREGQNVFDIMTGVAITILVKNPEAMNKTAKIHYKDIGDYLNRKEKLKIIKNFKNFLNIGDEIKILNPNAQGDWISQRTDFFSNYIPLDAEKKYDSKSNSYFLTHSLGLATGRDSWVYNYSLSKLKLNVQQMVKFYNLQVDNYRLAKQTNEKLLVDEFIDTDTRKISWNRNLKQDLEKFKKHSLFEADFVIGQHRPFCKNHLYFNKDLTAMMYQNKRLFPGRTTKNIIICVSGLNTRMDKTSVFISNTIVDLNLLDSGTQCFPLYFYEESKSIQKNLFDAKEQSYIQHNTISDFILKRAIKQYGKNVTREDIFYYIYGILSSNEFRETFIDDLKKMLPRLPLIDDVRSFWTFSKSGRKLAYLHLNYEDIGPLADLKVIGEESQFYEVQKLRFSQKGQKNEITYNNKITISNIPEKAYDFIINGKSPVEWVMEKYQISTNKDSGIINDPNDWANEIGNKRYILDLLLSVINVSVQTTEIINSLPKIDFNEIIKKEDETNVSSKENETEIVKGYSLHHPIYNIQDVMYILRLGRSKVKRWFDELYSSTYQYPGIAPDKNSESKELRISFHGLIELATIKDLRENKIPLAEILRARAELIDHFKVDYPFASEMVLSAINKAGKKIVLADGSNLFDLGGTKQFNFDFIKDIFKRIEFEDGLASRLYPMANTKNIVIDPVNAGGKAYIASTEGVWVEMVVSIFKTYNDKSKVAIDLAISEEEVQQAIDFLAYNQN